MRRVLFLLAFAFLPFLVYSCVLFEDAKPEPDNVSPTRSQLIAATGGFICLYREGANPVDLLYVKSTANGAEGRSCRHSRGFRFRRGAGG